MPDLHDSITISAAGMRAQSARMKVTAENIANADSVAFTPDGKPYQRKTITFRNVLDKETGVNVVKVEKIGVDPSPFPREYDPAHPGADAEGYVLRPNVSSITETMDMKEAQRSYEANLTSIEITKGMINRTLELMR